MATRVWLGHAPAVAQISTLAPENVEAGDLFVVTINEKSISYAAAHATIEDVIDGLVEAWNSCEIPEFAEITASDAGNGVITLTHDTPGVPFAVTASSDADGSAVNEVQTLSITGTPTGGTFTLSFDGETTTAIDYNDSAADVESALEALANIGSGNATCSGGPLPSSPVTIEFTGALATTNVAVVTSTSSLSGGTSPTIAIVETVQGRDGSDSLVVATPRGATGPNHWDNTANWTGGAVPVTGDHVVLANSSVSVKYGLDQSAVVLSSLVIEQSFTGDIGLPRTNLDGGGYVEYRGDYLRIGSTALTIGKGEGAGSGRLKIDSGADQVTLNVYSSGSASEAGLPSILWKGTHANNVVTINKGAFGAAVLPGESATIATLRIGYTTNVTGDVIAYCGDGVTLTTVNQSGGSLIASSTITTHNQTSGELVFSDKQNGNTVSITTLNLDAGAVRYRATGTLGTANVGSDGNLDFRQDQRPRTVTNCNLYERFELHDPFRTVTFTTGIDLVRCGPTDGVLDIGQHLTLTPSNI